MKNSRKFLILSVFTIALSLYLFDAPVAIASTLPGMDETINPGAGVDTETTVEPGAGVDTETTVEPGASVDTETTVEPGAGVDTETTVEPGAGVDTETTVEPGAGVDTETTVEPGAGVNTDTTVEPEAGAGTDAAIEPDEDMAVMSGSEPEPDDSSKSALALDKDIVVEPCTGADTVSTGTELVEWLEAHKNTGGTVKLADNVVLDEYYCFLPEGPYTPDVWVDTGTHTITVAGEVEFWSNAHLIFRGQSEGNAMLYVAGGGMLSLDGIIIECNRQEDGQPTETACCYSLWQEEGASLVINNCQISGEAHYADMPFVIEKASACAIVEAGQTAQDILPAQIKCSVNYQGNVDDNMLLPVSWNLTGTEEQQEKRVRFSIQGSFPGIACKQAPVCTVVYNDYPLTFTLVQASASSSFYIFRGEFTRPAAYLSVAIKLEYSFDQENWILCEEAFIPDDSTDFFMALKTERWDTAEHPNLYIRLSCEHEGAAHFSNILWYTSDNLEQAQDQGGNRGGGTSIINPVTPPGKPQEGFGGMPSESGNIAGTDSGASDATDTADGGENAPDIAADTSTAEGEQSNIPDSGESVFSPQGSGQGAAGNAAQVHGNAQNVTENAAQVHGNTQNATGNAAQVHGNTQNVTGNTAQVHGNAQSTTGNAAGIRGNTQNIAKSTSGTKGNILGMQANAADVGPSLSGATAAQSGAGKDNKILLAVSGFAAASVAAGAVGFCFHTGIFKRTLRAIKVIFK